MTVPLEAAAKKQGEDLKVVRRLFAPLSVFSLCLKLKHAGVSALSKFKKEPRMAGNCVRHQGSGTVHEVHYISVYWVFHIFLM